MPNSQDSRIAALFSAKREEARSTLRYHMEKRGLREGDGWRISETIRHREGRTELVLRPIHLRLDPPPDLECIVTIDEPGLAISTHCDV